ncbi:MAG: hypothetical protein EJNHJLOP_00028 [Methanophagales virus PBV082]|uniref:Uncharacterized protein n=1 Tax=Methanophagales virus PBV082 TaxID=3071307 RepID=A0AA46TDY1_9VIRU|nr:MAG: hypothetical protein QIT52_gp28 [Methanophagales virus PBV082]UYL64917.1 MAG: hypothetical protein EJNHJLOP_00028 [Methanophagales virus PBV082]
MEERGTPITEEYVNTLLVCFGISFVAGIIIPLGLAMLLAINASIFIHITGALLLGVSGLVLYLAYRINKKYEEQKKRMKGGDTP